MSKKKRRRRKRPLNPLNPSQKQLEAFDGICNTISAQILDHPEGLPREQEVRFIGDIAKGVAQTLPPELLDPNYFFSSPYGEAALQHTSDFVDDMAGHLRNAAENEFTRDEIRALEEKVAQTTMDTPDERAKNLGIYLESAILSRTASVWGIAMMLARSERIREEPYEGEHVFKYYSEATPRYQFIYRYMEKAYPNDRKTRHKINRMMPSVGRHKHEKEEDRIVGILLTELWMSGNNEFEIRPELRQMFMHTDIWNLKASTIKFPYPAFHVDTSREHMMFTTMEYDDLDSRLWVIQNTQQGSVQLREAPSEDDTLQDIWDRLPDGFWASGEANEKACREAFQVICNLCLYLECKDAEFRSSRPDVGDNPGTRDPDKLRKYTKKTYIPAKHVLYPSLEKTSSGASGRGSGTKKHWVRGHYRWQAYWPEGRDGQKVNKRIWIEPHMRGSETASDADEDTRTYKV